LAEDSKQDTFQNLYMVLDHGFG